MTFQDAIDSFDQNVTIAEQNSDVLTYNLNRGLVTMCAALAQVADNIHTLNQRLTQLERSVRKAE